MKKSMSLRALVAAVAALSVASANATVDSVITAGISSYSADGVTYATSIVAAGFAIWAVKKLGRKMGWW